MNLVQEFQGDMKTGMTVLGRARRIQLADRLPTRDHVLDEVALIPSEGIYLVLEEKMVLGPKHVVAVATEEEKEHCCVDGKIV
jgi:hypothetical protein